MKKNSNWNENIPSMQSCEQVQKTDCYFKILIFQNFETPLAALNMNSFMNYLFGSTAIVYVLVGVLFGLKFYSVKL